MKITGFETIPIRGRAMILKMFTDEGLVGFGEPMNYAHWRPVAQAVDDMGEYLIGRGPLADRGPLASDVPIQLQPEYAGASRCVEWNRDGDVGRIWQERWSAGMEATRRLSASARPCLHGFRRHNTAGVRGERKGCC